MAGESTTKEILAQIKKKYGENVLQKGIQDMRDFGTLSLGSPSLDFCLYNSFPEKRIIEFTGAEGSGKTSLAYMVAASYQRKEIQRNPENPRYILFVDLECGADPHWAKLFGYDMTEEAPVSTLRFTPEDMSAEEIFNYIVALIKSGEVGLIILDSINYLVPQGVKDEGFEKKEMGGVAKVLGDFVRRVTSLLIKYNCTLIGINQIRDNIGGYGASISTSGGHFWKHGCAVRLMIKRGTFFDEDGNDLKTSAESPAGYVLEMAVLKNKVSRRDRKLGRAHISYTKGIDIMQDTIEIATHFGFIDNSTQGTFRIVDTDTGELAVGPDGKEIKIRGQKNVKPYFEENPILWKKLYDKVYDKLSQKEDPNIISFERMLNINIDEKFGVDINGEEL